MNAFHTIAIPHDDILSGRLTMEVFAADLWEVYNGRGPEEYRDPAQFFQKTYLTEGLKNLLDGVGKRLSGEGGDPVIQVQTPFGGGKTHSQIAMYHKAGEWGAKRIVMVGTAMSAHDTLWGLLESQLTGTVREFTGLVAPGRGDKLRNLLVSNQPVLILMDEVLEYMTKAAGVQVGDSTLADQSIAFLQELTELVSTLDRVSLVITLPASIMEGYDEKAEQLFQKAQRVTGRVEKVITPVQEHEITRVIRRRLFSDIDEEAMRRVVDSYLTYAARESLLPPGTDASEYRQRFEASYPFLPEVVDVLYQRWGSFSSFQRTRGVLRLLALVIHALKDRPLAYIGLADFDLANQEIRRELLKHIGSEYDSVIASDITAPDSGARKVNTELGKAYQGLSLGSRVATTIFMYSFSGGTERGAGLGEIKRSATTLDNPSSAVSEALEQLKDKLFYLQQTSGKSYFTNQPNLNRILLTRMENVSRQQIEDVELDLLKKRVGGRNGRLKVFIWPADSMDIPDTPDLKLVLLRDAEDSSGRAMKAMNTLLEQRGGTPRVNRNTLFFLTPLDSERMGFENLVRGYLAYQVLRSDPTLTLSAEQREEVKDKLKKAEQDLSDAVRRVYRRLYIPSRNGLKVEDLGIATYGESRPLDDEVYDKLRTQGEILESIAPLVIKERYLQGRDYVSTEQLYQAGLRTPGESRAISQDVWVRGIADGVRKGMFGLGDVQEDKPRVRDYKTESTATLVAGEVLIREEVCIYQTATPPVVVTHPVPGDASQPDGDGSGSSGTDSVLPISPQAVQGHTSLTLKLTVPKGKVSSLMGVMNLLQSRFQHMEITLHVDEGQLSEQEYEDKVMETFRQMGVSVNLDSLT